MKISQVAAQLWTVRDFCKTSSDLVQTARKIRKIGYTAVQVGGSGPVPDAEVASIMKGEGLTICGSHQPSKELLEQPEKSIAALQKLGCKLTAYPFPEGVDFTSPESIKQLAKKLDAAGAKLREAGFTLGYHNHGIEFVKINGTTVLDYIYQNTDPRNLVGEIDTYWIHYGGGDCVEWCRKLAGRQPFIHLKDYGFTVENKPNYCEIGNGTLPFKRIIAEAEKGGCSWFIVEQDSCPGNPFESLRISFEHIKAHLVS